MLQTQMYLFCVLVLYILAKPTLDWIKAVKHTKMYVIIKKYIDQTCCNAFVPWRQEELLTMSKIHYKLSSNNNTLPIIILSSVSPPFLPPSPCLPSSHTDYWRQICVLSDLNKSSKKLAQNESLLENSKWQWSTPIFKIDNAKYNQQIISLYWCDGFCGAFGISDVKKWIGQLYIT